MCRLNQFIKNRYALQVLLRYAFLLVTIMLSLLLSAYSNIPSSIGSNSSSSIHYTDQIYGFAFDVPLNWHLVAAKQGEIGSLTQLTNWSQTNLEVNDSEFAREQIKLEFGVHTYDKPEAIPLEQWATPDPDVAEYLVFQSFTTIGDLPALRQDYSNGHESGTMFIVSHGKKVYFATVMPSTALINDTVTQILKSYTIEKLLLRDQIEVERLYPLGMQDNQQDTTGIAAEALAPSGYRLPFVGYHTISNGPGCSDLHTGRSSEAIDFGQMPVDTSIYTSKDGDIVYATYGWHEGFGNLMKIGHANGYTSWYAHLNSFVKTSGHVNWEERIAYSGNTGQSTGPHLHFEVRNSSNYSVWIRDMPGVTWYSGDPNNPCQPPGNNDGQAVGPNLGGGGNCNPNADQIALYVDGNYGGQCVVKGIGQYPNPSSIGLPNDSISSIKVGSNVKAQLCDNDNYGGTCTWFYDNDGNLGDNGIGNDRVSSVKVENDTPPPPNCNPNADQIALYVDGNYGGQCVVKGIGQYSNPSSIGLPNDSISSVKVGSNVKAQLCENDNYGGTCEWFYDNDGNLGDNGIGNDRVSSVKVESDTPPPPNCNPNADQIALYVDGNYGGQCVVKGIGQYPNPSSIGLPNDSISSIKVGSNVKVQLCENDNYGGTCEWFLDNDGNLGDNGIGNDKVSSVKVESDHPPACNPNADQIALYVDSNYGGQCVVKGIGQYPNPSSIGLPNDSISSVKIGSNMRAYLCQNDNYGGTCEWYSGNDGNLSDNSIGSDKISSVKVESACAPGANGVVLFEHPNYTGRCVTYTSDDSNLSDEGFNDAASSIKFVGSYANGWQAIVYEHSDYGGTSSIYQSNDPDFGNDPINHDRVSSIRIQAITPATPTLNSIENPDQDGNYTVNWTSVSYATSYELQEQQNGGSWSTIQTGSTTSKNINNRSESIWCYRVRASNDAGNSTWSNSQCTSVVAQEPDLHPFAPSGYSYPVVPSALQLTTAESTLYAEQPTYFDWHLKNSGQGTVEGNFHVEVWVDDQRQLVRYPFANIGSGEIGGFDDWLETIYAPGLHTIKIIVDPDNVIDETNEDNNVWERQFEWQPVTGWWGEYYNNKDLAGVPVLVRDDQTIDFDWGANNPGPGVPADDFSVRWTRTINFEPGNYRFRVYRDDGARLWIDNVLVLDEWNDAAREHFVDHQFTSGGPHSIQFEMYEHLYGAAAQLSWESACTPGQNGIVLYEGANFTGSCITLTADDPDFNNDSFNDMASSIRFVGSYTTGWQASLFEYTNYNGARTNFRGNDVDLSNNPVGNDRASSIRIWQDTDDGRSMTAGQTRYGTIHTPSDTDIYPFSGTRGQLVTIRMNRQNSSLDSSLVLYGPNWGIIAQDNNSGGGNLNALLDHIVLPSTGTYRIMARSNGSQTTGPYRLSLAVQTNPDCIPGLNGVVLYQGANYTGQCITLTADDPNFNDNSFDDVASSILFVGSYRRGWQVSLHEHANYGGTFTNFRTLDPDLVNNGIGHDRASSIRIWKDSDDGRWIASDQLLNGIIHTRTDDDVYYFSGRQGQQVTIRMVNWDSFDSTVDSYLVLYGPNWNIVTQDNNSGGETDALINQVTLPQTGTYRIFAKSYNANSTGEYLLAMILE